MLLLLLSRLVSDDDEDDGGNDDDDCAPNRPKRSALLLLLVVVEPLFNFAAFDDSRGEPLLPLLPWSGGVAGRMFSPPMLILLLWLFLLTAAAALLDFFKTCIVTYLLYIGYSALLFVDRHTTHQLILLPLSVLLFIAAVLYLSLNLEGCGIYLFFFPIGISLASHHLDA